MKNPILAATLLSLVVAPSFGATTWVSTANPLWGVTANWTGGTKPDSTISGVFDETLTTVFSIDTVAGSPFSTMGFVFNAGPGVNGFTFRTTGTPYGFFLGPNGIVNNNTRNQTFNVPIKLISASGFGGAGASQTWTAAAGPVTLSGVYSGSQNTLELNGATLTIDGAFNTIIGTTGRGDIVSAQPGAGTIVKNGAGVLTLGGTVANTFSGGIILNQGTIFGNKIGAFAGGKITLNGGVLQAGSFNQSGMGILSLQGNAMLDFAGSGNLLPNTNGLSFANSSSQAWNPAAKLTVLDLTITAADANSITTALRFGTTAAGLSGLQLSDIVLSGYENFNLSLNPSGFLIGTVPEPSTIALSLLGGFGIAFMIRRRKN